MTNIYFNLDDLHYNFFNRETRGYINKLKKMPIMC